MFNTFKQKIHKIVGSRKAIRYICSGIASEIIEYSVFLVWVIFAPGLTIANAVSFISGITAGYFFHKYWTFAGSGEAYLKDQHQIIGYGIIAATNLVLTSLLINLLAHQLHLAPALAKIITMGLSAAWTYLLLNHLVFKRGSV
jgi:putative flippase GtrA